MKNNSASVKTQNSHFRKMAIHDLVNGRAVYVLAFLVPLVILTAIYVIRGIWPFGDVCYLRSDMYHQYCPFFSELWEKIRTGGSLQYSWDIGLGSNFMAIYGYYLSSPINFFIALFPQKYMIEIMNVIIILKLAGSSLTCTYYLCKHNNKIHIGAAAFGLFYALSGYIAAFSWNIMWLDCILLLPLVILGLERLIREGKGLLYTFTLGLTILSNYYIAIMVCISCVIYFIVYIFSMPVFEDKTDYARAILRFILYSLLAGGLSAILLLPEIYALEYTASSSFNFPDTLTRYFSFVTIMQRHLLNIKVSTGLDHLPNIYCGVAVLLLVPIYITNNRISKREKVMKILALIVFFVAFNMNIPNFIWHGFHYPNSLPCRQSFIYIFLLLTICYDAVKNIKYSSNVQIAGSFWGVMIFLIYLGNTLTDSDIEFGVLYLTAIFVGVYTVFIYVYKSNKLDKNILSIIIFSICIVECTLNMENTGYSTTNRTYYLRDYETVKELTDNVENKDEDFYRISKLNGYRSKNESAWHNYKGASVFSSTAYGAITNIYGKLGLEHSMNAHAVNGATPLVYSILNVKYLLSEKELAVNPLLSLYDISGDEYLYRQNYTLPLGFMLPEDFNENWIWEEESNPFEVQNSFAESAAGITDLFTPVHFYDSITSADIDITEDGYIFCYSNNKSIKTLSVTIEHSSDFYSGIDHGRTADLGYLKEGQHVHITDSDGGSGNLQLYVYRMDTDKFIQFYEALADEGLNVTDYSDTHVNGEITVKEDGLFFASIPYDESFTLYVDGNKTEFTTVADAFIAFPLTEGVHSIRLEYHTRGLKTGAIISSICLIILLGFSVFRIKFKKEITEKEALSLLADSFSKKKHTEEEETVSSDTVLDRKDE
ncbi:MAG: YfhO family protein [Butyrivibrio sp.]